MSLLDIDKVNADRGTPLPNAKDKVDMTQRMAHGTTSVNYQTAQTNPQTTTALQSGLFRLVLTNTVELVTANSANGITTFTDAHNLGYVPMALAAMNNIDTQTANGTVTKASIFLPTWTSANIGTDVSGVVTFNTWLYHVVDENNIYINLLNASGGLWSIFVTYYLYQQVASG